ncbi:MAG: aldo/keto reductase, partial [Actinobacteria bacterium]|nr:aldo/keto reductase [Actinomycetota bacterium]
IDLYYAHFDDASVPLAETVGAFNDLVVAGKVRYVGVSNYSADRIEEWISIAAREGYALPVALQPHYNLVRREPYETELAPVVAEHDLGVMPYFSLASGFLSGKYRTAADLAGKARGKGAGQYLDERGLRVIDALDAIAVGRGVSVPTTALAWLRAKPGIVAPIASATTPAQVAELVAAASVDLTPQEVAALDAASAV